MCADLGIAIKLFQPFRDVQGCRRDRLARNLERAGPGQGRPGMEPTFPLLARQGEFDLAGLFAPIIKSGYTGPLSLEIFNDGFRAATTHANAADGAARSLRPGEKPRIAQPSQLDSPAAEHLR